MSAWDSATLTDDAALTEYESSFPEAPKKIKGEGGKTAYDGKRELAKAKIGRWLVRRGFELSGLTSPAQFATAATLLELSLTYRDMAKRNDAVSGQKAEYYEAEYIEEIEGLSFAYDAPATTSQPFVRGTATLWRS